jgi:hypothetical protein
MWRRRVRRAIPLTSSIGIASSRDLPLGLASVIAGHWLRPRTGRRLAGRQPIKEPITKRPRQIRVIVRSLVNNASILRKERIMNQWFRILIQGFVVDVSIIRYEGRDGLQKNQGLPGIVPLRIIHADPPVLRAKTLLKSIRLTPLSNSESFGCG